MKNSRYSFNQEIRKIIYENLRQVRKFIRDKRWKVQKSVRDSNCSHSLKQVSGLRKSDHAES